MPFVPPLTEQRFVLDHIVKLDELAALGFKNADRETVDAILEASAELTVREIVPIATIGDQQGACLASTGVVMPAEYRRAYRSIVNGGWVSLTGREDFGGQGFPKVMGAAAQENICAADMGFSLVTMLSLGAIDVLEAHGSPSQQALWLSKLTSGEWTGTMNLTEPQAGSDVGALKTSAVRQPDGRYSIKGQKIFITYGDHDMAENIVHLVLARTADALPGSKGISLFLVPKFWPQKDGDALLSNDIQCSSIEHKLGIHSSPTCLMRYGENDSCIGEIIGHEGGGLRAMFTMMNSARLNVGLQGVAVSEAATQAATSYAIERVQSVRTGSVSSQPVAIFEHPDVRRTLMRMKALTMASRALVYSAIAAGDRGQLGDKQASARQALLTPLAKAWCTDVGCEVASLAIQVHGGMGYVEETGVARLFRDIRIAPIYEGTNGIQAADLVNRKLDLEDGTALRRLFEEVRAETDDAPELLALVEDVEAVVADFAVASTDDRLAGSYPLLTMMAVAFAGGLMARQARVAQQLGSAGSGDLNYLAMKQAAARYFLTVVVSEARGLKMSALAGADLFYGCGQDAFTTG